MTTHFVSPTKLPIEAVVTLGVSVKENDDSIGMFGTGLKYAIAGILRFGGTFQIKSGREVFNFTCESKEIRGTIFHIVHCNKSPCGFTTQLGKHWQPWQLFRELASNSIDEGGSWGETLIPEDFETCITIDCPVVEQAAARESVFLPKNLPLLFSCGPVTIYDAPSKCFYYRGIRVGEFGSMASPYTINCNVGQLSEDRTLDSYSLRTSIGHAFAASHPSDWDESFLRHVVSSPEDSFWSGIIPMHIRGFKKPFVDWLLAHKRIVHNPVFLRALKERQKELRGEEFVKIPWTEQHQADIAKAEALCARVKLPAIARDSLHLTGDLEDGTLGLTKIDKGEVWISTKTVAAGTDDFLRTYIEEAVHLMIGIEAGHGRLFIDALLSLIINGMEAPSNAKR